MGLSGGELMREFGVLAHPESFSPHQAVLHPDAHEEGGLACNDMELLAEMRA